MFKVIRSTRLTRYLCTFGHGSTPKCPTNYMASLPKETPTPLRCRNKKHAPFHTSSGQHAAPFLAPILLKLTTPLSRLVFLLLGRRFRKWWQRLPALTKEKYMLGLTKNRNRLLVFLTLFGGTSAAYYVFHLEETPVTGRRRFMILSKNQLEEVANVQWRNLDSNLSSLRLPVNHLQHMKVVRIAKRILEANASKEVNNLNWEVNVINSKDVNAFVLANGQMYVYTGMLDAVTNDNELAGILGHEMAHAVLNHSAEHLSRAGFVNVYSIGLLTLLWAIVPTDGLAVVASWLQSVVEDLLISLPYSRKLEREADEVGLLMAARACFDVRHVPKFWERMRLVEKDAIEQQNDWLSTHPSHKNRIVWLQDLLPHALALRSDFKCPELTHFWDSAQSLRK